MFFLKAKAFRGFVQTHKCFLFKNIDPLIALKNVEKEISNLLKKQKSRFRFVLSLCVTFEKLGENEPTINKFYFSSKTERVLSKFEIKDKIKTSFNKVLKGIEEFINNGSGWSVKTVNFIELHIGKYHSLRGGCQSVCLPKILKNKKCLLSVKCNGNECFLYSVMAGLFPKKVNQNLTSSYKKHKKSLSYKWLDFPVKTTEVPKFEKRNNLKINVYGFKKYVYPIYKSKVIASKELDLLLYKNHYFLIKNFNRLMHEKHGIHYHCKNCLVGFARQSTLNEHEKMCLNNAPRKTILPSGENKFLSFKGWEKTFFHPFIIYADFESIIKPVYGPEPNNQETFTQRTQKHEAACYSFILLDHKKNIVYSKSYFGEDCVENFIISLKNVGKCIFEYMKKNVPMIYSEAAANLKTCHLCGKMFSRGEGVLNHDHLTGEILGKACVGCNLNYKFSHFIPVVMHNLRGYDSHLILEKISGKFVKNIKLIPLNTEKCISFTLDNIRFLDSFSFLSSKLDSLVENLKNSKYDFPVFNSFFDSRHKSLLLRKGVFPYNYFTSFEVLKQKSLPDKSHFFNNLNNSNISDEDFNFANKIFKKFKCVTFKDYLSLYLNTDVVLLADVFENFRELSNRFYNLDPVHFYTTPSLTWSAGLKYTNVTLELLTDINMYLMLESGIRGGMVLVSKRFVRANNKYLKSFNPSLPSNYIVSVDVNNLYGSSMSLNKLPVSNFKWLSVEEIKEFNLNLYDAQSDIGFILEVDLSYPEELHDLHNEFPLAPNHEFIPFKKLSPLQKTILKSLNLKHNEKNIKLLNTFYDKKKYVVHYLNLKFYLKHGLKLEKIHRILKFKQSSWLKPYIDFNNDHRKKAKNSFDKDFFKLLNNAFFGRTCMNTRKHVNVKIALDEKQCKNYLSNSGLEYFSIINKSSVMFKILKSNLYLNQPIYVGFTVLELSKLYMFHLYYDIFKPIYKDKISLIYTDTDSLCLQIFTKDVYVDFSKKFKDKGIFDFSNYEKDHYLFSTKNKAKLGCLKDETRGIPIEEFIALRPKMYSYIFGKENKRTAKGIKKNVLKSSLKHKLYLQVLKKNKLLRHKQTNITSKKHVISTTLQNKCSLSSYYDKMYLKDNINCLAFGHFSIK